MPIPENIPPQERAFLEEINALVGHDITNDAAPKWAMDMGDAKRVNYNAAGRVRSLYLHYLKLSTLPESLGNLTALTTLDLFGNNLTTLPESLGNLTALTDLYLSDNQLTTLPASLENLTMLTWLGLSGNKLTRLPEWLGNLTALTTLPLWNNYIATLPASLGNLTTLTALYLDGNPLDLELKAALAEGGTAGVLRYLREQADSVPLHEAKLVLVGEGAVGKTCLLDALRGDPFESGRDTTHGIEIRPVVLPCPGTNITLTLNAWDFGGQKVYRPTHQMFFSPSAVYLAVWKPREGTSQGMVEEWIALVRKRAGKDSPVLVVATHGGPGGNLMDINRQTLFDKYGVEIALSDFRVNSRPDAETGEQLGIATLQDALARAAHALPDTTRTVPRTWQIARKALQATNAAYLPLEEVQEICHDSGLSEPADVALFLGVAHLLGRLTHYEDDRNEALRNLVILRPEWFAKAVGYIQNDEETRVQKGLVTSERLAYLWQNPPSTDKTPVTFPLVMHPILHRLMERYEFAYKVEGLPETEGETWLVAQLVDDVHPTKRLAEVWPDDYTGAERTQVCRMVTKATPEKPVSESASAEGLFYRLIVRLHKYSLGRHDYLKSVHWQQGLIIEDGVHGRAYLRHIGNDIHVTVRAAYPLTLLARITGEVESLAGFWEGIECRIAVPCPQPGCRGAYDFSALTDALAEKRKDFPCPICQKWKSIEMLLSGFVPEANTLETIGEDVRTLLQRTDALTDLAEERFDRLDASDQQILSRVEGRMDALMTALFDQGRDGPCLFSLAPVETGFLDKPSWTTALFDLTLWCEHSQQSLPFLNGGDYTRGVYRIEIPRDWLTKAAPYLRALMLTLSAFLPLSGTLVKAADDALYKGMETHLDLGKQTFETMKKLGEEMGGALDAPTGFGASDTHAPRGGVITDPIPVEEADLRRLQEWLRTQDPGFGGLCRVRDERKNRVLWVHPMYRSEY